MADLSGRMLGEFMLREQIDEGGYGAVYRGEQWLLERDVVVKVLHAWRHDDVSRQRFLREAKLASRLDHPYAAHVYASGVEAEDGLPTGSSPRPGRSGRKAPVRCCETAASRAGVRSPRH